jgi:hypothetical protein
MSVFVQTDPNKAIDGSLLDPHYTNRQFDHDAQTVFLRQEYRTQHGLGGDTVKGCSYDYSDRISGWFTHEKQEAAWEAAKRNFSETKSAAFIQEYLRILYEKPNLVLVHILSGVNRGNGYPYRVYGYIAEPK